MTIVPSTRLLLFTGVIFVPAMLLAGVSPALTPVGILAGGALAVLAVLDAVLGQSAFDGFAIRWPDIARLTQDRPGDLTMQLTNESKRPLRLRVGLDLPPEIKAEDAELRADLPAGADRLKLRWPVTPTRRGRYLLDTAYLELPSPLGFWEVRRRRPLAGEVRVYPNLMGERNSVAALFLNRGGLGVHAMRQVGKGRDFEKLREYIPGDSYDEISWKATAKRGYPVTKIFQIERTQEVYCVVDSSRLSMRAPEGAGVALTPDGRPSLSILDRAVLAALTLGVAAERQGDLFGLLTFSDKVQAYVPAKSGKGHYDACREALYTLQPRPVAPDFLELFTFIRTRLRKRALLVFLTSLDDPALAESFARHIDLIGRQHLVLVNMIAPPGARPLFSDENVTSVGDIYRRLGGHLQWAELRRLEKILYRRGVQFQVLENERLCPELVAQYINIKQRQVL